MTNSILKGLDKGRLPLYRETSKVLCIKLAEYTLEAGPNNLINSS
jgi:hypothetical protein